MKYLLVVLLLGTTFFATSQTIKLVISGVTEIAGETVIAFETGDTTTVSFPGTGGMQVSAPRFEPIKIKKPFGTSTSELFRRSVGKMLIPETVFQFHNASGELYFSITLREVVITHFSFLSPECINCASLVHQLWFHYNKIEWEDVAKGSIIRYDVRAVKFY